MMKKQYSPKTGEATESLACPLCGWVRPVKYGVSQTTGAPREVRFDKITDLEHFPVWRLERLLGRGKGKDVLETKTLAQLPPAMRAQIKSQCQAILKAIE